METQIRSLGDLIDRAMQIWIAGGPSMIGIALVAFFTSVLGINLFFKLNNYRSFGIPEVIWRRWVSHPEEGHGKMGELIRAIAPVGHSSEKELVSRCEAVFSAETGPVERDLGLMKTLVTAAPLVGLLGTVMGMLFTFGALSTGSGGERTMALIASGISEALITTKTGLVVAIPGLFFQHLLSRKLMGYQALHAHLETVCVQSLHLRLQLRERARLRTAAAAVIARTIHSRLDTVST